MKKKHTPKMSEDEKDVASVLIGCPRTAAKIWAARGKTRKAFVELLRAAQRMLKRESRT